MLNSEALETAIALAFLFLSISLVCTAAKEWLEGIFKWRAMDLERALRTLLADPQGTMTAQLLQHPLLSSLFRGRYDPSQLRRTRWWPGDQLHMRLTQRRQLPSYIPAAQFATALLDSVARGPVGDDGSAADGALPGAAVAGALSVAQLRSQALGLASPHVRRAVLAALDQGGADMAQVRAHIERWFDGTMDRASGWYKRRTQTVLFLLGLAIATGMNIDSMYVIQQLTADKALREVIVKEAASVQAAASAAAAERVAAARDALERIALPIGWRDWSAPDAGVSALPLPRQLCRAGDGDACSRTRWLDTDWLSVLCGWFVTALAVSLGAPFWFDLLNRFMVVRSSLKPPAKSAADASTQRPA